MTRLTISIALASLLTISRPLVAQDIPTIMMRRHIAFGS